MIQNGRSPYEQAMDVLGLTKNDLKNQKLNSMNHVFFKPNTQLVKWLIKYAGDRLIIDAGSGAKFYLSQQLIKNGATKVVAIDTEIDTNEYMKMRMLNEIDVNITFHVILGDMERWKDLYTSSNKDILMIFARPCHSDWVENVLDIKSETVECLYITLPENLERYDDL